MTYRYYVVKTGQHYSVLDTATKAETGRFPTRREANAYADKMVAEDREIAAAAHWLDGLIVA